jgi:uncharacterized protein YqkB
MMNKTFTYLTIFLFSIVSSCDSKSDKSSLYGIEYNVVRKDFGAPLVKQNMHCISGMTSGMWTVYIVDESDKNPLGYHESKTVRALINENVSEEEDIYKKRIGHNFYQLNVLSRYNWKDKTLSLKGNVGMIGEPNWTVFSDSTGIDSVLISWGLSRFDKE